MNPSIIAVANMFAFGTIYSGTNSFRSGIPPHIYSTQYVRPRTHKKTNIK